MTRERNNSPKKNQPRVAVVAAGVISPLGAGLEATLEALRAARDCISTVTRFPVEQCRCTTAGQVDDVWLTGVPDFEPGLSVVGTTSGGMSFGEDYYRALERKELRPRHLPSWIANYPPQKPVVDGLEACGLSSPCQVIPNACASGSTPSP